jgi:hypothetical protein
MGGKTPPHSPDQNIRPNQSYIWRAALHQENPQKIVGFANTLRSASATYELATPAFRAKPARVHNGGNFPLFEMSSQRRKIHRPRPETAIAAAKRSFSGAKPSQTLGRPVRPYRSGLVSGRKSPTNFGFDSRGAMVSCRTLHSGFLVRPNQISLDGSQARSAPPMYKASGLAPRAIQPKAAQTVRPTVPVPAAPFRAFGLGAPAVPPRSVASAQSVQLSVAAGQRTLTSPAAGATIQRRPSGVIQRVPCPLCGVDPVPFSLNGDDFNGHDPSCPYYWRSFQTAADRQATQTDPYRRLQRSHSFRVPVATPGGLTSTGLFVGPSVGYARVHQHDNNITGPAPVLHYR